jgi:predicted kinase
MSSIVIVTGAPGTGKTALAALLSEALPRGLHIPSDVFYSFPAHPIPPYRAEADDQNADIIVALAQTSAAFARRGYDVFLDGIFGPWFLPLMAAELMGVAVPVDYVVLCAPLEVALARAESRSRPTKADVVRQMHVAFADLGSYEAHAIDAGRRTLAELGEEFRRRQSQGDFMLDLRRVTDGDA